MSSKVQLLTLRYWVVTLFFVCAVAHAETGYVTDMLQLDMYATQAMDGKPVKKLRSGDSFEILERTGRYARVRLPGGQTGWVKSLYIVATEPARTRLNVLAKQNADLTARLEALNDRLAERESRVAELEGDRGSEAEQLVAAEAELASLRERNMALESTLSSYGSSVPLSWLIIVSLLALALGIAAGWYFIDSRSRAKHGGYRVY